MTGGVGAGWVGPSSPFVSPSSTSPLALLGKLPLPVSFPGGTGVDLGAGAGADASSRMFRDDRGCWASRSIALARTMSRLLPLGRTLLDRTRNDLGPTAAARASTYAW